MEPAREERDDLEQVASSAAALKPQWSPLVKSGMTPDPGPPCTIRIVPQWSPLVKSGMTPGADWVEGWRVWPQWSPLVKSGMTARLDASPISGGACRNGARS